MKPPPTSPDLTSQDLTSQDLASQELASHVLAAEADVIAARAHAGELARLLGFAAHDRARIAASVWEIAHNAFVHANAASTAFSVISKNGAQIFVIRVEDKGAGVDSLDTMLDMRERQKHVGGLAGVRMISECFEAKSILREGTIVVLGYTIPARRTSLDAAAIARTARKAAREIPDADTHAMFAALHEQNCELLDCHLELHRRREEGVQLNRELADTNRGVVALYAELEENAAQLRQASELKSHFLSNMSHEFRTPLNSIMALSRLLIDRVDGDLSPEQEKQVGYIRHSAGDLLDLINDLLDLAKVEAGKIEIRPAAFRIDELFGALRGALKPLQVNTDVELLFESDSRLPALFTDEAKLAQILRNLISNALKFTESGKVHVSAVAAQGGNRIVFSIRDSGIGIEPTDLERIFEQFTQIDTMLQRHVKGTGLGLPLSRKLAMLLGGDIQVESTPGQGSCFSLDIPVSVTGPSRKRLLIIDDDATFRYVFRQMLPQETSYELIEADNGADGLKRARDDAPALIVLDLQMPEMDGFSVLREIADDPLLQAIPVVISSSLALTPEVRAKFQQGQRFLPKSDLSRDKLVALLRETFAETVPA